MVESPCDIHYLHRYYHRGQLRAVSTSGRMLVAVSVAGASTSHERARHCCPYQVRVASSGGLHDEEVRDQIPSWMKEGRIKNKEDVVEGQVNAPRALIGLMQGENFGKLLVKVSEE